MNYSTESILATEAVLKQKGTRLSAYCSTYVENALKIRGLV